MKFLLRILWIGVFMLSTNNAVAEKIQVSVTGIDVKKGGNIVVYIFTSPKGFPRIHKEALLTQTKKASASHLQFELALPETVNQLAIKVLHDRNGDGKVTKNWTGFIPKDGLGFSNNQKLSLKGLPSFESSIISKPQLTTMQKIVIRYYSK